MHCALSGITKTLWDSVLYITSYTVPKEINFPRYSMKCSRDNVILRGIFHVPVVSCFPRHLLNYRRNFDYSTLRTVYTLATVPMVCPVLVVSNQFTPHVPPLEKELTNRIVTSADRRRSLVVG